MVLVKAADRKNRISPLPFSSEAGAESVGSRPDVCRVKLDAVAFLRTLRRPASGSALDVKPLPLEWGGPNMKEDHEKKVHSASRGCGENREAL